MILLLNDIINLLEMCPDAEWPLKSSSVLGDARMPLRGKFDLVPLDLHNRISQFFSLAKKCKLVLKNLIKIKLSLTFACVTTHISYCTIFESSQLIL